MREDGGRMATGYFWSILAMMSAPFVLVGIVATVIVRAVRHTQRTQ